MANPTISIVSQPGSMRVVLHVSADVGSTVSVVRIVDGVEYPVRGATLVKMVRVGELILADYEVPQNQVFSYLVRAESSGTTVAGTATQVGPVDFGGDVIFDLSRPWDAMTVFVESFPSLDHDVARDVVPVWDRADPVVVSGRRQYPSGTLNLITLGLPDRDRFLEVIRSGNVLAFSPRYPSYGLDPVMYLSVGKVQEARTTTFAVEDSRRWALEVQQVRQPASDVITAKGSITWQQVKDTGGLWSASKQTWLQMAGF